MIRFAVVGVSGIGAMHIRGIKEIENATLSVICDISEEIAKKRAEENGVSRYETDYYKMLKDGGFDAVIICTPDQLHREQAIAAIEHGYHVLCEKPLALNMEDCRAICNAASLSNKKFMVGQVCRKAPGFMLAKQLYDKGEIGELFFMESEYAHDYAHLISSNNWRTDPVNLRPAVIGGGCHAIDLIRWFAGNPTEVFAYANHKTLLDWPVDDFTVGIMKFANGVIGKVMTSIGCKRNYSMRTVIYGTKGTIITDNTSDSITLFREVKNDAGKHEIISESLPVDISSHNVTSEIRELCDAIMNEEKIETDSFEGANTVAVGCAMVRSAATGKPEIPEYIV